MPDEVTPNRDAVRNQLLARIEAVFENVELGNGVSLHQARAIDDYSGDEEIAEVRKLDTECRWQDVSDEKLDQLSDALWFMDAAGFRFYIPRFITFALRNETSDSYLREQAIRWAGMTEEGIMQFELLSDEQRAVLREVAKFFADEA